jgi:2-polyprenyl-6-methoxyphenol hydroxylase-like FAD-dependent oxidoreductase
VVETSERVIVAGGSVGGLAVAMALGRAGHHVTIVERDVIPIADGPEAAFASERTGAPQAHQTHGLLARLMVVLRERFPDVLQALFDAGAYSLPMGSSLGDSRPDDDDLYVLIARRTTLEWVLRRAALAEPNVELRSGAVITGLIADAASAGATTHVTGAVLADGSVLEGTVIACTGRRGDVPAWLGALGVEIPEVLHDTEHMYLTRWYRLPAGFDTTIDIEERIAGDLRYLKYMAVPGDGNTLSATLAVRTRDSELRAALLDPDRFDHACSLLPGPDRFFKETDLEPIGPVRPMGGLINRLRTFTTPDGSPKVTGFHAVGDAHTCTNPLYGRGCSLALVQATLLADAFAAHPDDVVARAAAYEAASRREVEPWFHYAVQMDEMRPSREAASGTADPAADPGRALAIIMSAAATDPVIGRAIFRVFNLLALPESLATDPDFVARVATVLADPASAELVIESPGPTRAELLDAIGDASSLTA